MLEKPDLPDEQILARLWEEYGLREPRLTFLPLGADMNSAVYRVDCPDGKEFFLKLRKDALNETIVTLPQFLHAQGIQEIIAPVETRARQPWAVLDPYRMILYPFIEGKDGYEVMLSDRQWTEFGAALRAVHAAQVPPALAERIPREQFSPRWREAVTKFQELADSVEFDDPLSAKTAAFLRARRERVAYLVTRAEQLARAVQSGARQYVLCHSDIHAGNLLIPTGETAAGSFYIVDWDEPIFAPKERDLMFVGSGMGNGWDTDQAADLFYQGYAPGAGQAGVDRVVLAYYRYERIVTDIAVICEQIFSSSGDGEDRQQSFGYLTGNFEPGGTIQAALKTDV